MEIRKLSKNDYELKSKIAEHLYRDHGEDFGYDISSTKKYVDAIVDDSMYPFMVVAIEDNNIAGRSGLVMCDAPFRGDIYPCILPVHIEKEYEGQGLAKKILNKTIEESMNLDNISPDYLYVFTIIEGFYEKFGFEFIHETITNRLSDGTVTTKRLYRKSI